MMTTNTVNDIRMQFRGTYIEGKFAENDTIEILNASFIADEDIIFGSLNINYAKREIEWYKSESLNINDIPGDIPRIWQDIATEDGRINSNYGWCIFSSENGYQAQNALKTLFRDKHSRQATMIYIRPSMHEDSCVDGMKDFMCTYSAQMFIRNDTLHYIVYMRSNDAVFGYKNDRYWHNFAFDHLLDQLQTVYPELTKGNLYWNAASLHVYPRHYHLIEESQ